MAKWCQKWPHLCQFEIKDHFIVWTSAENVPSNLFHLPICCGPLVCFFSCKWNVLLLMWGFMWRLTAQHTTCVCRAAGNAMLPFALPSHSQVSCHLHYSMLCHYYISSLFFPHLGLLQDLFPSVWSFSFDPILNRCTFVKWSLFGSFYIDIKGSTTSLIWQLLPAIHRLQNTPVPWLLLSHHPLIQLELKIKTQQKWQCHTIESKVCKTNKGSLASSSEDKHSDLRLITLLLF